MGELNLSQFLKEVGGVEGLHEALLAFERRHAELETRRAELLRQYPNKWVALCDGQVMAADTLEGLLQCLAEKGVPSQETPVEYLDPNPLPLVL